MVEFMVINPYLLTTTAVLSPRLEDHLSILHMLPLLDVTLHLEILSKYLELSSMQPASKVRLT